MMIRTPRNISHSLSVAGLAFCLFTSSCKEVKKEEKQVDKMEQNTATTPFLVGTWTNTDSKGIYKMLLNTSTGALENKGLVATQTSPSYLYISPDKKRIYSVNEKEDGSISTYKWNDNQTQLIQLNESSSKGNSPCYIEVNNHKNLLAAANYASGDLVVYRLDRNGVPTGEPQYKKHSGSGPYKPNQDSPHAHCSKFSKDGKYLYTVDLGTDEVNVYAINDKGELGEEQVALALDKGDGSRHLIFHPTKNIAYISNEISSSVVVATIDPNTGLMERIDKKSTLPEDFMEDSYVADLHLSSNGKFLYVSNRGHNSIAIFAVADNGSLTMLNTVSTEGNWPRNFQFSPDEAFMLVANQESNDIAVFNVNQETGMLSFTGHKATIATPVFIGF